MVSIALLEQLGQPLHQLPDYREYARDFLKGGLHLLFADCS
jgi:hypothetical protein